MSASVPAVRGQRRVLSPAERREQLLLRSAVLREQVAAGSLTLQPALRTADRVRTGLSVLRQQRGLAVLGAAALVGVAVVRPRLMLDLGMRAWSGWQLYRRVQPLAFAFWRKLQD